MTDIAAEIAAEEGGNRPPPAEALRDQLLARYARLLRELDDILTSAATWQGKISSKAEADAIVNLEAKIRSLIKEADIAHAGEKLPFKLAVDVIDGFFLTAGIKGKAEAEAKRIGPIRAAWQKADADAKQAIALAEARKLQEEANALRRAEEQAKAEEQRQEAARAAARAEEERLAALRRNPNADPPAPAPAPLAPRPAVPQTSAADFAQQAADRARAEAEQKPNKRARIVTDLGASANLRQIAKGRVIKGELTEASFAMLLPHIDIEHLNMAANRLAKVVCIEGEPVPENIEGIMFYWEVK